MRLSQCLDDAQVFPWDFRRQLAKRIVGPGQRTSGCVAGTSSSAAARPGRRGRRRTGWRRGVHLCTDNLGVRKTEILSERLLRQCRLIYCVSCFIRFGCKYIVFEIVLYALTARYQRCLVRAKSQWYATIVCYGNMLWACARVLPGMNGVA